MELVELLKKSVIVAAHPDDEVLWFSSILADVDEVILCYNDLFDDAKTSKGRKQALAEFPHDNISSLDIMEAGVFALADWENPRPSAYGIELNQRGRRVALKRLWRQAKGFALTQKNLTPAQRYERNYALLVEKLRVRLALAQNVFGHNPWGEYGNEEHIQVFRALSQLRDELGFKLWVSAYASKETLQMALGYVDLSKPPKNHIKRPTNKQLAAQIMQIYQRNDCWTWFDDWQWFDHDLIMEAPTKTLLETSSQHHLFPLNVILRK